MKKNVLTSCAFLCLAFSACVEDAELFEQPDLKTVTTADVQNGQVTLKSDIGDQPYCTANSERGFVLTRRLPDGSINSESYRVDGVDFAFTLTEDLWSNMTCEAYAYVVTDGRRYRSGSVGFRPSGGKQAEVTGVRVSSDANCDVTGRVTVYGQHLTNLKYGTSISLKQEVKGNVVFSPVICTLDSLVFDYECCNIGTWDMMLNLRGVKYPLDRQLVVDGATLRLDSVIYAGMPHRITIDRRSKASMDSVSCWIDNQYQLTTRCDLMGDDEWYAAFTGLIGQEHRLLVCYREGHRRIYLPEVIVNYTNAWEPVAAVTNLGHNNMSKLAIGGYGWRLEGGWNGQSQGLRLHRLDFRTGELKTYFAPCKPGQDGVKHLLGYERDYCVFGEADGQKVYCAAYIGLDGEEDDDTYHWAWGRQRIRLYEFDIQDETWTWLYDMPATGSSNENNGYQIWSKRGEHFYFINYILGEFGWWDRVTGELVKESQPHLFGYYNDYVGSDSNGFYFRTNDLKFVSFDDASKYQTLWIDILNGQFRVGAGWYDYLYSVGVSYIVQANRLFLGQMMCSSPTSDLHHHTFYGTPDGLHGCDLYPVGDEMYCVDSEGKVWRFIGQ